VDICPVGALTDRDFRFQCRVWFLGSTSSICPGCSRGCNIEIHYNERYNPRYHEKRVHRLKPRFNPNVNRHWMCDEGRYSYHDIDSPRRLKAPALRSGGELRAVEWEEAIRTAAGALRRTVDAHGPQAVGVLASPRMSNEELFLLRRLFADFWRVEDIACNVPPRVGAFSDDFLITSDRNPNARGARALGYPDGGGDSLLRGCADGRIRFLYLRRHDLTGAYDMEFVRRVMETPEVVVYHGAFEHETAALAGVQLPCAVYAEKAGTFTNLEGRVQRFDAAIPPLGQALPDLEVLVRLAEALGTPVPAGSAAEVFRSIGEQVPAFAGMTYESIGCAGQLLRAD
jgi:NADH-quinone oxidoreductase subunit G